MIRSLSRDHKRSRNEFTTIYVKYARSTCSCGWYSEWKRKIIFWKWRIREEFNNHLREELDKVL